MSTFFQLWHCLSHPSIDILLGGGGWRLATHVPATFLVCLPATSLYHPQYFAFALLNMKRKDMKEERKGQFVVGLSIFYQIGRNSIHQALSCVCFCVTIMGMGRQTIYLTRASPCPCAAHSFSVAGSMHGIA